MVSTEYDDFDSWLNDAPAVTPKKNPVKTKATSKKSSPPKKHTKKELHSARPVLDDIPLEDRPLSPKQELFCQYYIEDFNGQQAAIKAGYSEASAKEIASENLTKPNVAKRIKILRERAAAPHIATSTEVMQFFSDVMNGKIKDQFGLEASLADRTRAGIELAKRTVDLDQKLAGKPDATIEIKLDWKRD